MIVEDVVVLSVLCQLPPCLRDVHEGVCPLVDGVELNDSVRVLLVDSLELYRVVVQR